MTVKEIYDNIENFTDEQREEHLQNLSKQLCEVSIGELRDFQNKWNYETGDMAAFFKEQTRIFKRCITLEISDLGKTVRTTLGLEPLKWDTEIVKESKLASRN